MGTESSRRELERLPGVYQVEFKHLDEAGKGVVVDLSTGGMRLRTNHTIEEGMLLSLSLVGPDYQTIQLDGKIRWLSEMSPTPVQPHPFAFEAGILVPDPSEELASLFDKQSAKFIDFRDWPRFPQKLRIDMAGPGVCETTFALNISRRGLFLMNQRDLDIGQMVQMRTSLEGSSETLELHGNVVYLLTQEDAEEVGTAPGVGVRLGNLAPATKQKYLEFLDTIKKKHGTQ